jgi:hypothetical protein
MKGDDGMGQSTWLSWRRGGVVAGGTYVIRERWRALSHIEYLLGSTIDRNGMYTQALSKGERFAWLLCSG